MTDVSPLFRPFTLRGMELKNRIVIAPMTRSRSPGAFPNAENVAELGGEIAGRHHLLQGGVYLASQMRPARFEVPKGIHPDIDK